MRDTGYLRSSCAQTSAMRPAESGSAGYDMWTAFHLHVCGPSSAARPQARSNLATSLRAEAYKIGTSARAAGTTHQPLDLKKPQKHMSAA
jgi:hypothetical protein